MARPPFRLRRNSPPDAAVRAEPARGMPPAPKGMPLPLLRWRGFTLQMFLIIVVPLAIVLVVVVLASQTLHHDAMRELVGDRDLRAVRAAATSLSHALSDRAAGLEVIAYQTEPLPAGFLDQAAQQYGFDGGLALFDAQGKQVAHSTAAVPELLNENANFVGANAVGTNANGAGTTPATAGASAPPGALDASAMLGKVRISQPFISGDGRWLCLALAQLPSGSRLVGGFTPAGLARATLTDVATAPDSVYLLSPAGNLVYQFGEYDHPYAITMHPGVPEALRGESGVNYTPAGPLPSALHHLLPFLGPREPEHVIAFAPVAPLNWGLVMEEPWESTVPALLNVTQLAPLLLAPILLLALLALWFGGRQIIEPLQSLEIRADALAAGDFPAIREPVGGIEEIQHLQGTLVGMAGNLESTQDALHSYIGALTAGVETERQSLARELHDDTLQALIALNQHVQMQILRAPDEAQRAALQDLQGHIVETITSLRRSIGGLRPVYLEDLGLPAALRMLARDDGARTLVEYASSGAERRLSPEAELAFYRIAQAALNNALLHAEATQVNIQLDFTPERVSLCIADNGRGFQVPADPGAFAHSGHYGLLGMKERADLVGASLDILSAPGEGTQVIVEKEETPQI